MITNEVYEKACNENRDKTERALALLDCVEAKIGTDLAKFINILRSESYCTELAEKIVLGYNGGYFSQNTIVEP